MLAYKFLLQAFVFKENGGYATVYQTNGKRQLTRISQPWKFLQ